MADLQYFCCFNSYLEKTRNLRDAELGRLFRALMIYSATGERVNLPGPEATAFDFIADDVDKSKQKYLERCRKNSENQKKRWEGEKRPSDTNVYETYQTKNKNLKPKSLLSRDNKEILVMGEYENVVFSPAEYEALLKEFPDAAERIDALSGYLKQSGKNYKSHYATIRNWAKRAEKKAIEENQKLNGGTHTGVSEVFNQEWKDIFNEEAIT